MDYLIVWSWMNRGFGAEQKSLEQTKPLKLSTAYAELLKQAIHRDTYIDSVYQQSRGS